MVKQLMLPTMDHKVLGSNSTGGGIQLIALDCAEPLIITIALS